MSIEIAKELNSSKKQVLKLKNIKETMNLAKQKFKEFK
jgi:hypothetical protein